MDNPMTPREWVVALSGGAYLVWKAIMRATGQSRSDCREELAIVRDKLNRAELKNERLESEARKLLESSWKTSEQHAVLGERFAQLSAQHSELLSQLDPPRLPPVK